ncbi:MAG: undecaprenyl/decaprenyl-phosphate alpha-N-acetylglucosaminyl 1-phosphate transferase [Acidobacteria bacterium]|nr:MAG: undecaprenyl/decaprenyl-phosphate alpha-N-acetylglucosaminyl 1-phosphate transferase [Acidobacteriota bacterium]
MPVVYLGIFALSLILSFVLTRYVRNLAVARGWLSLPTFDRHLHNTPLPRLGGVAIFLAFLLSAAAGIFISWRYQIFQRGFSFHTLATILLPAVLIFMLGVLDDVRGVGPYLKFAVQALAASMLFIGGLRILDLPVLFGAHQFPWFVGLPLTIVWVLAITNAFNLIDGLDGLAAGSALFSTLIVFVVALLNQSSPVALMTIALAGAILGFLRYNFNPATIFLGDCGSLFIGFLLSALALESAQKAPTIIAVAIPVVSFGLPILETALSVLRRLISGRPLFTADREHIHHKLLQRGLSHRQVVIVLYAVSALFALLSLFLLWPTGSSLGLVLAVLGTGIWMGVQHLGYLEFGELRRVAQRTMEQRQIFINNLAIRRATEELKVTRDYEQLCRILVAAFGTNDFDAFDLSVKLLPNDNPGLELVQAHLHREQLCFGWTKSDKLRLRDSFALWNLTLDLVTTSNRRRGSMSIQRLYTQRDLQLDVNLLTAVFPVALADALDRVLGQAMQVMSRPEESTRLVTAQAG